MRTGAQVLADILVNNGTRFVFHMPGESFLSAIDALNEHRDKVTAISCRNETGMAVMAEATGKLTGTAGICLSREVPARPMRAGCTYRFQDSRGMIMIAARRGSLKRTGRLLQYRGFPGHCVCADDEVGGACRSRPSSS